MKIGGFIKQSLIDFPGKISCVIFTKGCNFRCKYCHNPELVIPKLINAHPSISENEIFEYIIKYKHLLDAVSITGGEPCIQKDLQVFIEKIKSLGLLVKLDTNGTFPEIISELINNNLLDYIAMDIKAPLEHTKYEQVVGSQYVNSLIIKKIIQSKEIISNSSIPYEFRTTIVKGLHIDEDIVGINKNIQGKWFLQLFSNNKILEVDNEQFSEYNKEELNQILITTGINTKNIKIR